MKKLILAATALAFASAPAFASPQDASNNSIKVQASSDFQEELTDDYGDRELEFLTKKIRKDITREFAKAGIEASMIDVTILEAKPNRPTLQQLSDTPGLSLQSFSIGGMELSATAYGADGAVIGELEYGWFENDIRFAKGNTTWSDARRASNRFARKFAKKLAS